MWIPAEFAKPPKTFFKTHGGIYRIRNTQNDFVYVGQTINFKERYEGHLYSLRRDKGINPLLQADWNAFGEESFVFELVYCFPNSMINVNGVIDFKMLARLEQEEYARYEGRRYNIYPPRGPSAGWQVRDTSKQAPILGL